jgi:hypothetical protein
MNDNHIDITSITARILTLIRAKTPNLNQPYDIDIDDGMLDQICEEFPDLGPRVLGRAIDGAHVELNKRHLVDRILALIAERTPKLNPTSSDVGLTDLFYQMCSEYPDLGGDPINVAFDRAHGELIEQHLRMVADEQGTRH